MASREPQAVRIVPGPSRGPAGRPCQFMGHATKEAVLPQGGRMISLVHPCGGEIPGGATCALATGVTQRVVDMPVHYRGIGIAVHGGDRRERPTVSVRCADGTVQLDALGTGHTRTAASRNAATVWGRVTRRQNLLEIVGYRTLHPIVRL